MKFEGNHEMPSLEFIEDEGRIKIWGRSIAMEIKLDFWQPLLDKLEDYLTDPRDITLILDFDYFNTPSAKEILNVFKLIDKSTSQNKRNFLIKWMYEDEDMLEAGEDFCSIVSSPTWKFIKK
jgi:hypothetical protein